jgi:hypothetical protein
MRWQVQQITGCAVHAVSADHVGGGDVLQTPVTMPQQRRDAGPGWLSRLSLGERDQLGPVFDYHVLASQLLPQHALHPRLTDQHMPAMIPVRGKLHRAEHSALLVDGGVRNTVTGRKPDRAEPALLQEFRCQ